MMNRIRSVFAGVATFGFCVLLAPTVLAGDVDYQTARFERQLRAVRTTGAIKIDGMLDEPDWGRAPVAKDFVQNEPREGQAATEDTEVRVLYDTDNLYIGVFAHDNEPQQIITSELTKDFNLGSGDEIEIVLDTFHDERNGYIFATNAWGAKWDGQMVNEGRETNANWDAIWEVKTRIAETGWFAEIAIPFRTLRFAEADPQTWGINFQRKIRRRNEDTYWSPLPRIYNIQRVSMAGTLDGLQGIRRGNDLRVKPYLLGSSGKSTHASVGNDFNAGLDVKYGITKGLTWDFTVNTDFSQVEADEQQVNLTRFSLFFPEKRDFFLENSGVFQFGQGGGFGGLGNFGRLLGNIANGRTNQVRDPVLFFSRRIGLSEDTSEANAIPILAGTRLTGRAGAYTLGALNLQQRSSGTSPSVNFTALRLRRDVLANSDVGVMVLNKDAPGPNYNRVAGIDGNFRFFENLNVNAYAAKTFSPTAIVGTGGDDTIASSGIRYRNRFWDLRTSYLRVGKQFNDEMGFVERVGTTTGYAYASTHFRSNRFPGWMRESNPHYQLYNVWYVNGDLQSRYVDYHFPISFQDGSWLETGMNAEVENLIAPFVINGRRGVVIAPGRYDFNEWFLAARMDESKPLAVGGRWGVGNFYDGYKQNYQGGAAVRLNGKFNAGLVIARNQINLPAGRYTTNLVTARINYGFSTKAFLNALLQYNTDAREWSSNVRFNIIHHPLSDFFLVVNERRDSGTGGLLDRAVIAKMTYMVAF